MSFYGEEGPTCGNRGAKDQSPNILTTSLPHIK
jgi:hypothetical protein